VCIKRIARKPISGTPQIELIMVETIQNEQVHQRQDRMALRIRKVCESVGEFIDYWGFKAIHGRVWTLLALRREPMSQTEIADFLQVSRSLVNGTIRELSDYGLVRAVSEHRNSPYRAVVDIWPTISDVLREREWMLIENAKLAVESAIEEADFGEPGNEYDLERLRYLLRLTELAQTFLRSLIGIRISRRRDNMTDWVKRCSKFMRELRATH